MTDNIQVAETALASPLGELVPVFVDIETYMDDTVSLRSMTLRQYLAASHLLTMAISVGYDDVPQVFYTKEYPGPAGALYVDDVLKRTLQLLARDPKYVFVAHNAAFDMRGMRAYLDMPHPINVWCTLEGSMGAWPEMPDGYKLSNLSEKLLPKGLGKYEVDLREFEYVRKKVLKKLFLSHREVSDSVWESLCIITKAADIEWDRELVSVELLAKVIAAYNVQDVIAMREIYKLQIPRLHPREQAVALRTHHQRRHYFCVDQDRLAELTEKLDLATLEAANNAGEYLTKEQLKEVFNRQNGSLTSVRSARLKGILNASTPDQALPTPKAKKGKQKAGLTVYDPSEDDEFYKNARETPLQLVDEEFTSTSLKKISPLQMARNPNAAAVLAQTSRANKMLSHKRRSGVFTGVTTVDAELGYARATTMRFSSPSCGRGLNLHNVPKHDVVIAKPVRKLFRLPDNLCFVRADLANVECRVESLLTNARVGIEMFDETRGGDINADPYIMTWKAMTGVLIKEKKSPIRQVAKGAVLGLGFIMSATGYAKVLLNTLADKKSGVTEATLRELIISNGWKLPDNDGVSNVMKNLGCSQIVALAAFSVQRVFNETFPEYARTAGWIVGLASEIASCGPGHEGVERAKMFIDRAYTMTTAPDRNLINITAINDGLGDNTSMKVGCGFWPTTLTWREPKNRVIDFGDRRQALTVRKASGEIKPFTRQLAIENVTQAAARNAMCMGVEKLDAIGFKDVIHVHDEVLIIVERKRLDVLAARDALVTAFGPSHGMPWAWSILVKPDEITVTESLYEDEDDIARFLPSKGPDKKVILGADDKPVMVPGPDRWGKIERDEPGCLLNLP